MSSGFSGMEVAGDFTESLFGDGLRAEARLE